MHLEIECMKSCLSKLISNGIIEYNTKSLQYTVAKEYIYF